MATDAWRSTTLGEVLELKRGYDLPSRDRRDGPYPIVSSSGISGCHAKAMAKGPGVVTGRYGTIGQVFYITRDFWPLNTSLYVRDFKGNDPRFISYFLRTLNFLAYSDKAAVPGLNRNHLHMAEVIIPPVPEQKAIAAVLGALDDKIDVNQAQMQALEAVARTVFKSWFVNFDPVRRAAAGEPMGLPEDVAALFPTRLVNSPIGEVPDGWRVESMGSHFEAAKGLSYKGAGLADYGMPMHNLNSVYEGGGYKYPGIKYYNGEYRDRHLVRPGDVIVANTEQGHDHLLIGYPAIVPRRFGEKGLFSHHLYRVRPKPETYLTNHYIYQAMMTSRLRDEITGHTNGTTVNMLSVSGLEMPLIVVPPAPLVKRYESVVKLLFERVEVLHDSTPNLAALRDVLLPKLVSGEIRLVAKQTAAGRAT